MEDDTDADDKEGKREEGRKEDVSILNHDFEVSICVVEMPGRWADADGRGRRARGAGRV